MRYEHIKKMVTRSDNGQLIQCDDGFAYFVDQDGKVLYRWSLWDMEWIEFTEQVKARAVSASTKYE